MRFAVTLCLFGELCFAQTLSAAEPAPTVERFEKSIRPLLASKCWACHGPEKTKGGLRLDSAEGIAAGGESGPIVVSGKPEESRLIDAIKYATDLKMPPKGKLSEAEIAALIEWVRTGAAWPSDKVAGDRKPKSSMAVPRLKADAKSFWAFQPIRPPVLPEMKDASGIQSPIDRFIVARLREKGLKQAPPTDKRTLIRRATFDLTGIPPTPEEIDAFLADDSREALEKVVDRLLASPRYGERWGRRWLDLARFADSNGMDENVAYANAFRYRDYVIRSFNSDKPYDQFLKEQIAGDLLPKSTSESANYDRLTATGFLVIGPKMLAEDDPVKMEMDIIDEQVDTVGRVFMGLTLGCARCHDHKFDPISTADYYALAGIFKSTKSMQNHKVVAMWNERPLASEAERLFLEADKKAIATRNVAIKSLVENAQKQLEKETRTRIAAYLLAAAQLERIDSILKSNSSSGGGEPRAGSIIREAEAFDSGNVLVDTTNYGKGIGVILNRGQIPNFTEYTFEIPSDGLYEIELRYAAAEARPVRLIVDDAPYSKPVAASATGSWTPETQAWSVAGRIILKSGRRRIRLEREGPFPHIDKLALTQKRLPEGVALTDLKTAEELARPIGLNPRLVERWRDVLVRARTDPDSIFRAWHDRESLEPGLKALIERAPIPTDEQGLAKRYQSLFEEADKAGSMSSSPLLSFRRVLEDPKGPFAISKKTEDLFPPEVVTSLRRIRGELEEMAAKAPPVPEAMSVEDQKAANLRIHIRGNHMTLGEEVRRGFPVVLASSLQDRIDEKRSGRLELAEWLASPDHPLTARVIANRIWLGHFGEGLVRSPDNFGKLGERPDHPELLDWLALRLIESKWSIKSLHRVIMLSSTYQMSSRSDPDAALLDPENRLLWKMSRRRLDAEEIRDAMLAVSDELHATMGGSLLKAQNHAYVYSTVVSGGVTYDVNRRSIYLPVIRSGLYDVFQTFDFADPSASNGKRVATTVAPQALFMLNDRLVLRTSEAMAKRLVARPESDDRVRIRLAYRSAFGRFPSELEIERSLSYLKRFDAILSSQGLASESRRIRIWQTFCQALMASSEFITLD